MDRDRCYRLEKSTRANELQLSNPGGIWMRSTYVFEALALVVLQQAVSSAEVAIAEAAVADYTLGGVLAGGSRASDLLGRHFVVSVG